MAHAPKFFSAAATSIAITHALMFGGCGQPPVVEGDPSSLQNMNPKGLAKADAYASTYHAQLAEWPLQPERRVIETKTGRTHVLVWGPKDAPPLVLLHGAGAAGIAWIYQAEALGQQHRVYAPDVPGHSGLSVAKKSIKKIAEYMTWLDELLDALELQRVDMLGISMGGAFAIDYALHAPARVNRLVLLSPAMTLVSMRAAFFLNGIPLFFGTAGTERFMRYIGSQENAGHAPYEARLRTMVQWFTTASRHFGMFQAVGVEYPSVLSDEQLRTLRPRTLVIIGEQEVIYDAKKAMARAALIPNVKTALIIRAGHDICWSQPERLNTTITEFLTSL